MSEKRDNRYDFFKGMLMIGVVLGHVLTALQGGEGKTYWIHEFVRTYDMPMFAFISGVFLKKSCEKRSVGRNILNKISSMLFPAVLWGEIYSLLGGRIIPSIALWFLFSLFFSSVIVIIIDKVKNVFLKMIFIGIMIILFHTLINDPFNIGFLLAPTIIGYFFDDIKRYANGIFKGTYRLIGRGILVILFFVAQSFWSVEFNVWNQGCCILDNGLYIDNTVRIVFRFAIGILGCLLMMDWFGLLFDGLNKEESPIYNLIKRKIILFGKNTLELYVLHSWFVSIAGTRLVKIITDKLGYNPFIINEKLLLLVLAPAITIFTLLSMYWLSVLIKKIPLFGRFAFSMDSLIKK